MFFASQRRINNKFMSKTIILIPSRLSASRLPGKPLLKINGMTLINHVYKKAIDTKIGEVYVTTGDIKIYEKENEAINLYQQNIIKLCKLNAFVNTLNALPKQILELFIIQPPPLFLMGSIANFVPRITLESNK